MPSWVTIYLDTAAPVVAFGAVGRPTPGTVEIPYNSSPDTQTIEATLEIDGLELPVFDAGLAVWARVTGAKPLELTIDAPHSRAPAARK